VYISEADAVTPRLKSIAVLVVFALSVVLYAGAVKLLPSHLRDPGPDLRDEVDDVWAARIRCHVCQKSYAAVEMDRDFREESRPPVCDPCATGARARHFE
jgi:hypothetical protein